MNREKKSKELLIILFISNEMTGKINEYDSFHSVFINCRFE